MWFVKNVQPQGKFNGLENVKTKIQSVDVWLIHDLTTLHNREGEFVLDYI